MCAVPLRGGSQGRFVKSPDSVIDSTELIRLRTKNEEARNYPTSPLSRQEVRSLIALIDSLDNDVERLERAAQQVVWCYDQNGGIDPRRLESAIDGDLRDALLALS